MGKFFAVILIVITLASAYPIVTHKFVQPVDISTHGHAIDEQLADTMAEAGFAFRWRTTAAGVLRLEVLQSQRRLQGHAPSRRREVDGGNRLHSGRHGGSCAWRARTEGLG